MKKRKSFGLYNVVSVRGEFWVSPWRVSHAENVIRGAYDDCGHFNCYVVEVKLLIIIIKIIITMHQ